MRLGRTRDEGTREGVDISLKQREINPHHEIGKPAQGRSGGEGRLSPGLTPSQVWRDADPTTF